MQKYDLHTHLFSNWRQGKHSLERAPRTPEYVLDSIAVAGLSGIVLTNFGDSGDWKEVYERFAFDCEQGTNLGGYKLLKENSNSLIFEGTHSGRVIRVIKAQEIPTSEENSNHVVALALDKRQIISGRCLGIGGTLRQVKNIGAIADADHAFGILGIGLDNLRRYTEYFDFFERNLNYESPFLKFLIGKNPSLLELEKIERELGIPCVPVSDCHNRRDLGNGYIEVEEGAFDFSSADNLRDSIRETLRQRKFKPVVRRANSAFSVLEHISIVLYDVHIRNRLGWVNLESP